MLELVQQHFAPATQSTSIVALELARWHFAPAALFNIVALRKSNSHGLRSSVWGAQ